MLAQEDRDESEFLDVTAAGRRLPRLHGHGTLLPVLQLDHLHAQQAHQRQRGLQVYQHPGHLRLRELRGEYSGQGIHIQELLGCSVKYEYFHFYFDSS